MKKLKLLSLACLAVIFSLYNSCQQSAPACQAVDLRVDYTVNPIGIDNPAPLFSWQMEDLRTGAAQQAYQILVASSPKLLAEGKTDWWDSGKQPSNRNKQIAYNGQPLKSCSRYYWTVQLWDNDGQPSGFSEPVFFETAYLDTSEWKGEWITNTEDTASEVAPLLRKTFDVKEKPVRATAYVAGVGYHELFVNNQEVSGSFLEPGYTRFDRRVLYLTYDVTNLISAGKNAVGVMLGNGWYNVQTIAVWYFEKAPWRKSPRLLMDLRLEYADGSTEWISTDNTWKTAESPVRFNSLYAGEVYDARLELPDWSSAAFDDSDWLPVLTTASPGGLLSAQALPPVKIVRTIKPTAVHRLDNGKFLFDLGQNFTGVARLKIQGEKGTRVTLRFGERIHPDQTLNTDRIAEHMRIPEGGHPFQTDIYILKGEGEESYTPHFTYHGFQYVEVVTEPAMELNADNLEGLFLSTDFEEAGTFRCSNDLLNKLFEATRQSYLSNFQSIPTDCPHREKNGWTGDAHIACEAGLWSFDGINAYRKWLQDLRDEQRPTGELPGIVPTSGWGYHWGNGPAWDSALPVIAWTLFQNYGDTTVLRENYDAVKSYVDYLGTRTENGIQKIGLGDWVSIVKTPVEITSTGYYYYDALVLSKMAAILGKTSDQEKYAALAENIRRIFNETFLDPTTNRYRVQTQTALSCAVFQGLVPEQALGQTISDLISQIEQKSYHPDFGLLGSKYVLNVLHSSGNDEIAYQMLNSTEYPGWGHWIAQGATTLWEDWDGGASLNHIFLGDFTSWFFKALGGIQIDPAAPGFDRFLIKPSFVADLSFVECSHRSINGPIISNWKREKGHITMELVIPANTQATVVLPDAFAIEKIREARTSKNIKPEKPADGNSLILKAGSYLISLKAGV